MSVTPSGLPTLTVEIGFVSDPTTAIGSTTWTDVSAFVRNIRVHRGRQHELDRFEAGTMTVTLDNRDRRFDPTYTSSPYSPNVLPMRRIRFRATYNAVTYDVFNGFIESWPQSYVSGPGTGSGDATVEVDCVDGFKVLNLSLLPGSVYELEVRADSPAHWWRLGESSGTVAVDQIDALGYGTYSSNVVLGGSSLVAEDSTTSANFPVGTTPTDGAILSFTRSFISSYPFTIEAWFSLTDSGNEYLYLQGSFTTNYGPQLALTISNGVVYFTMQEKSTAAGGVGGFNQWQASGSYNDGAIHHVVVAVTNATTATIYMDGSAVSSMVSATGSGTISPMRTSIGNWPPDNISNQINGFVGQLQDVVLYGSALSSARAAAHYNAGKAGAAGAWGGQLSGTRIGKVLDAIGWPAADRNVDAGVSTLQPVTLGQSALEHAQTVETSENGAFYMQGDGKVRWRARHTVLTAAASTTSQATFGDSGSELQYADVVFNFDDTQIRNRVLVQREGGVPALAEDTTSKSTYLTRSFERTGTWQVSDGESVDAANWILSHYKNADLRVESLKVLPRRNPTVLFPQVLGRVFGDRITVKRRPPGSGTISKDVLLEGVSHTVSVEGLSWETEWQLSPAESQSYWVLGTSSLGTDTRLAY